MAGLSKAVAKFAARKKKMAENDPKTKNMASAARGWATKAREKAKKIDELAKKIETQNDTSQSGFSAHANYIDQIKKVEAEHTAAKKAKDSSKMKSLAAKIADMDKVAQRQIDEINRVQIAAGKNFDAIRAASKIDPVNR